ncbi:hypothetical protein BO94DRAFT_623181 [Aspergillus sclerotioniger CBS 115572]|uniref:Rhodopsin domain-containing protein n=1 Tax=Aspergillus sclerotioniger CBS 115572 TaxID=1450535 RepID=A0A317X1H1_9EURO|nr:hypothetical protein BO94DRAFT_623181 [Aspergillus sclerotioniger CBS 115572]PWY90390.1 hypothetical protein BO94DRAFT_623181 [Aspergillus sclerotioniger CBS 115572]
MFCCPCLVYFMSDTLLCSVWGNAAVYYAPNMSPNQKKHLRIGTQIGYAGQYIYATYLWAQKGVVLCFIERLLGLLPWPYIWIRVSWAILIVTFIAIELVYLTVCIPAYLYWQIEPAPDSCAREFYPIDNFLIMDCITDAMLLVLPFYWLFKVRQPLGQRLWILAPFSIGIFLIAVTSIRLWNYSGLLDPSFQVLLNPIEELFSAIVANVPTLWSLRRARQPAPPPIPMHPPPKRVPRALNSILITETTDVEHYVLEEPMQSTNTIEESLGDESDGHLVRSNQKEGHSMV